LKYLGVDGRVILKIILNKKDVRVDFIHLPQDRN
jgi:hypothetical protein